MEFEEVDEFVSKKQKLHLEAPPSVEPQPSVESGKHFADGKNGFVTEIAPDSSMLTETHRGEIARDLQHHQGETSPTDALPNDSANGSTKDLAEDASQSDDEDENQFDEEAVLEILQKTIPSDIRHLSFPEFLEKYDIMYLPLVAKVLKMNVPADFDHLDEILIELKRVIDSQKRKKRPDINTLEQAIDLIQRSKNILVITGAGVSVSCGIPDFRSKNGVYSRLDEFELEDPQQMFDIEYFRYKPETFYAFAREIYPTNFKPSPSHAFIKLLESKGKLLRNYTQNIDTLEQVCGISRIIQCHGSFSMAKCIECDYRIPCKQIEEDIFAQKVPLCPKCYEEKGGIIKPEITFFGEKLPKAFDDAIAKDASVVDLLIVIGSSLKVAPVADVKDIIPHEVPQILINMESLSHMQGFDIHLLGYCDTVVTELCRLLKWDLEHEKIVGGSTLAELPDSFFEEVLDEETGKMLRRRKRFYKQSSEQPYKYYFEGALGLEDMHPNAYAPSGQEDSSGSSSETDSSDSNSEGTSAASDDDLREIN